VLTTADPSEQMEKGFSTGWSELSDIRKAGDDRGPGQVAAVTGCGDSVPAWGRDTRGVWKLYFLVIQMIQPGATKNHRITEWQGLEGTSVGHLVQSPLPKQGHLQQAAQDLVQAGLEYLQRRRLHGPSNILVCF